MESMSSPKTFPSWIGVPILEIAISPFAICHVMQHDARGLAKRVGLLSRVCSDVRELQGSEVPSRIYHGSIKPIKNLAPKS